MVEKQKLVRLKSTKFALKVAQTYSITQYVGVPGSLKIYVISASQAAKVFDSTEFVARNHCLRTCSSTRILRVNVAEPPQRYSDPANTMPRRISREAWIRAAFRLDIWIRVPYVAQDLCMHDCIHFSHDRPVFMHISSENEEYLFEFFKQKLPQRPSLREINKIVGRSIKKVVRSLK